MTFNALIVDKIQDGKTGAALLQIVDRTTGINHVVIGRSLQKHAKGLPTLRIPKGYGE